MSDYENLDTYKPKRAQWTQWQWLRIFTIVTACFHFIQFVILLSFGKTKKIPTHIDLQLWPLHGSNSTTNHFSYLQKNTGSLDLEAMIAAFFFLSFAFQFAVGTVFWKRAAAMLKLRAMQPFRFLEYAVSASLMTLIFAVLVGIEEVSQLWLLFISMAVVMLLGLIQEYQLTFKRSFPALTKFEYFIPHLVGWIAFFAPVCTFITKFSLSISNGPSKPPDWVYAIYASQFIIFGSFGITQLAQQIRLYNNYADEAKCARIALQSEFTYIFLSLSAKSVLAWILYANLLAESSISY